MKFRLVLVIMCIFLASSSKAKITQSSEILTEIYCENTFSFLMEKSLTPDTIHIANDFSITIEDSTATRIVKFKRGKAILFTLFTGFIGGHRIYFGTHHRTPIIYSITFGGLGILPLIDLVHILFTKDLSRYEHKSQIIMWGK